MLDGNELRDRPAVFGDDHALVRIVNEIHQLQALSLELAGRNLHAAASQLIPHDRTAL
ncbi:MAG: hypothetical protein ACOC1U_03065 [Spirochaetota bacterium]